MNNDFNKTITYDFELVFEKDNANYKKFVEFYEEFMTTEWEKEKEVTLKYQDDPVFGKIMKCEDIHQLFIFGERKDNQFKPVDVFDRDFVTFEDDGGLIPEFLELLKQMPLLSGSFWHRDNDALHKTEYVVEDGKLVLVDTPKIMDEVLRAREYDIKLYNSYQEYGKVELHRLCVEYNLTVEEISDKMWEL